MCIKSSAGQIPDKDRWIVHVPSMLPDEEHPYWGIFMEAHISSVASFLPCVVYYAYALNASTLHKVPKNDEHTLRAKTNGTIYRKYIRRYRRGIGWQFRALIEFLSWTRKHRCKIKLLHAHGTVWGGIWCIISGLFFKIPVLVSEHSSAFPRRTYPLVVQWLARMFLPRAQALLPVTANLGTHLRQYAPYVPQHVIPNCIDTRFFKPTPLPREDILKLLFIGSFVPVKRVDLLLHALVRLKTKQDFSVRLAGTGPLMQPMRELAKNLGIDTYVDFLGFVSREQVRDEIMNCHAVVLSSEWESQPCILLEAILSGRPVVGPRVGGVPEMVDDDCGCLFNIGDKKDLVTALETVADKLHRFDYTSVSERFRRRHSYESVGIAITKIYKEYSIS